MPEELKGLTTDAAMLDDATFPLQPGDEGYLDPVEVEKKLLAEEEAKFAKPQHDDAEIASMMLSLYTPRFNMLVDKLSNRELKRLIKALVEFPLGKTYKHVSKEENEAFMIGQGLMDAKMVLVVKTYSENKDKIIAMADEAMQNSTLEFGDKAEEEKKEEVNG